MTDPRRAVPRTDAVLADPRLAAATERLGRATVKLAVQRAQQAARDGSLQPHEVADAAAALLPDAATTLQPVINATGVVLHTNLGRAPLSPAAREALAVAAGYVDVEYDAAAGHRARRGRGTLAALRRAVPAAEDVHVVNNGAAALVLAATALAQNRDIVISRGELVEIGDGFRIPALVESTGAKLREVGTTNRTSLDDYARVLGETTGFILKVHPSNFRIDGFTGSVGVSQLAGLGVPVVADVGSGLLTPDPAIPEEPDIEGWLREGAALVTASGDKLLGGPQAGIIAGRADLVERLRRHPLARAVRVDKLTLAALEATLTGPPTPTWEAIHADSHILEARAEKLADQLKLNNIPAQPVATDGAVGGGGAPGKPLPGWAVELDETLAGPLRSHKPCIVGRVERGRLLLDLRCVDPADDDTVRDAVVAVVTTYRNSPC